MKIDIVIPCAPKDAITLDVCLNSCRRHIKDEIAEIYVVSREDNLIKKTCEKYSAIWKNEDEVLDKKLSDFIPINPKWSRWGWMYQQFIKMAGNLGECENYLVVDSDLAFTKDIHFFEDDSPIFYFRDTYHHVPFFESMNKLIDIENIQTISFVCDFMIFNRQMMADLKSHIEEKAGKNWMDAIVDAIDYSLSPFSEFETYGTFYKGEIILSKLEYHQIRRWVRDLDQLEKDYPEYNVVVMPRYLRKDTVVSVLVGRLGNKMFEIAAAASFAERNNKEFVGCIYSKKQAPKKMEMKTVLQRVDMGIDYTGYKIFIGKDKKLNSYLSKDFKIPTNVENLAIFNFLQDPKLIDKNVAYELFGIYDSIEKSIEKKYGDLSEYVCVNVRRGDYLLELHQKIGFKVLTADDINEMINLYFPDDKVLFVSDDIEWCKENFKGDKYMFADKPCRYKPEMDLYLQTKCGKGNIISNSTFSWWGAYLNPSPNKKVVAPYPWFNNNYLGGFKQIYPEGWIKYNTETHDEEN